LWQITIRKSLDIIKKTNIEINRNFVFYHLLFGDNKIGKLFDNRDMMDDFMQL